MNASRTSTMESSSCDRLSELDTDGSSGRLAGFRTRLKRFVQSRLNARLSTRVDASDIVQDVYVDAARRLRQLSKLQGEDLYRSLRRLACERIVDSYRRHLQAQRRSVLREVSIDPPSGRGPAGLIDTLMGSASSPSRVVARGEELGRLRLALDELSTEDREVLVLRYLLQLNVGEISELLEISRTLVTTRHWRALDRVRRILERSDV